MAGNGTSNNSFVAGNALPSALHTGTNSGMITNGMQSRSVGGKRKQSKRMHGGETLEQLNDELASLQKSLGQLSVISVTGNAGKKYREDKKKAWTDKITEIEQKIQKMQGSKKSRSKSHSSKRSIGGEPPAEKLKEKLENELQTLNTKIRQTKILQPYAQIDIIENAENIKKWSTRIEEIKKELGLKGGKKRKSHKNKKTSRKTKKWFGLF
jgi:hypothetical protein